MDVPKRTHGNLRFFNFQNGFSEGGQVANSQETMSSSAHLPPLGVAFLLTMFQTEG